MGRFAGLRRDHIAGEQSAGVRLRSGRLLRRCCTDRRVRYTNPGQTGSEQANTSNKPARNQNMLIIPSFLLTDTIKWRKSWKNWANRVKNVAMKIPGL